MPENSEEFSYNKHDEPYRLLEPYEDITSSFLEGLDFINESILETSSFRTEYEKRWNGIPLPDIVPLAVNPDIIGNTESFEPPNPFGPGHLASPVITNTGRRDESRAWLFVNECDGKKIYTMLKGTGVGFLSDSIENTLHQFGQHNESLTLDEAEARGWGSIGGVLDGNAANEFYTAYTLTAIYERVFGKSMPIRAPRRIFDISSALRSEGAQDIQGHYQIEYNLRTPVRASYCSYLSDLGKLWNGVDLETADGVKEATERINEILMAYPRLNGFDNLQAVEESDIQNGIYALQEYETAFYGDTVNLKSSRVGELRYALAQAGYGIAEKFFKSNEVAVKETLKNEAETLGKTVGLAMALGIDLRTSVSSKDAYGCEIADLDVVSLEPKSEDDVFHFVVDKAPYYGLVNIKNLGAMLGCTKEVQIDAMNTYLKGISEGFKATIEHIDEIGLSDSAKKDIRSYQRAVSCLTFEETLSFIINHGDFDKKSKISLSILFGTFMSNEDLVGDTFEIGMAQPDITTEYRVSRRDVGQHTSKKTKNNKTLIDKFIDEKQDILDLDLTMKEGRLVLDEHLYFE